MLDGRASSSVEELMQAARHRLSEIEAEAEHLRSLIEIYSSRRHAAAKKRRHWAPWPTIRQFMADRDAVSLDELEEFDRRMKLGLTRRLIRQQIHNWRARNLVESVEPGIFRLTEKGRATVPGAGN